MKTWKAWKVHVCKLSYNVYLICNLTLYVFTSYQPLKDSATLCGPSSSYANFGHGCVKKKEIRPLLFHILSTSWGLWSGVSFLLLESHALATIHYLLFRICTVSSQGMLGGVSEPFNIRAYPLHTQHTKTARFLCFWGQQFIQVPGWDEQPFINR